MSPEYESSSVLLRRAALQHGLAGQAALEGEFVPRAKLFLAEAREIQLAAHRAGVAGGAVAKLRSDPTDILFDALVLTPGPPASALRPLPTAPPGRAPLTPLRALPLPRPVPLPPARHPPPP